MSIVHKRTHYLVPANHYQEGLGFKLFGINFGGAGKWLKKGLNAAIDMVGGALKTAVPFASKWIDDLVDMAQEEVNSWDLDFVANKSLTSTEAELTAAEEAKLDAWLSVFQLYAKKLAEEVGAASKLSPEGQIVGLNRVLNKIDILQRHYEVTPEAGLSAKALYQRNVLISQVLSVVYNTINACIDKLKEQGQNIQTVTATVAASSYSFSPLFSSTIVTTVSVKNYKLAGTLPTTGTTPVTTTPVKDPATGGIVPTTGTTTTPAKKTNTKLIVAGIGAAALAVAIFSGSGSSGTKKTGKPSGSTRRTAKRKK